MPKSCFDFPCTFMQNRIPRNGKKPLPTLQVRQKPFLSPKSLCLYLHPVLKSEPDVIPAIDRRMIHQRIPCALVEAVHGRRENLRVK